MKIPRLKMLVIPALLWVLGFFCNVAVMAKNYNQMPVFRTNCPLYILEGDSVHTCMNASSHLKLLADWIHIPGSGFWSPGDVLMWFAETVFPPLAGAWIALLLVKNKEEN